MHPKIAEASLAQIRQRVTEGDCPTTPAYSIEVLEELVLHFADRATQPTPTTAEKP